MENEEQEDMMLNEMTTAQEVAPAEVHEMSETFPSELVEPMWSVVSFESVAATGLTYDEARKLILRLADEKVSGLCIITDDAAAKINT
jgi:hypothetical protein